MLDTGLMPDPSTLTAGERCLLEDYKDRLLLAGGAVRDYFFNREVRDYDFYINAEYWDKKDAVYYGLTPIYGDKKYNDPMIDVVYTGKNIDFITLFGEPVAYVKENFSVDLCKCYHYVGEGSVVITKEAYSDYNNETLTYHTHIHKEDHLQLYLEKLLKKYKGFKTVKGCEVEEENPLLWPVIPV